MQRNFCHLCGGALEKLKADKDAWRCTQCGKSVYLNASACVDVLLFNEAGKALITRRMHDPHAHKLDVPGGYVDIKETLEQAAQREMYEELGLEVSDYSPLTYKGSAHNFYPWEGDGIYIVGACFAARLKPGLEVKPKSEVSEVLFVDLNDVKREDLAWDYQFEYLQKTAREIAEGTYTLLGD